MAVIGTGELDELVAAIWGPAAPVGPIDRDPDLRAKQNEALSIAIRMYLQSYLDDASRPRRADTAGA